MKKLVYLVLALIFFGGMNAETRADSLKIGSQFPVEKLSKELSASDNTIIAFIPSLAYDCEYASMLTQSFYYYFDRRLAFEGAKKSPGVRIFLVVRDKMDPIKSTQNILGRMSVIYDEKGELFSAFEIRQPADKNADSTIVLLDRNDRVAHLDENYRAQGERLKPLENKLRELNGIYRKPQFDRSPKALKVGDRAPDFRVNEKELLSDLKGKVVLISFYPAAFSGVLPKPFQFDALRTDRSEAKKWESTQIRPDFNGEQNSMSCFMQTKLLDLQPKSGTEARRIVISSSTAALLEEWRKLLGTQNIEYVNDPDYAVSLKYLSYNSEGYNNRVSIVVDKEGKIAYLDTNFEAEDEALINAKIEKFLKK